MDIAGVLESLVNAVWGLWFVVLLAGAGLLFSVATKFIQFKAFGHSLLVIAGKFDDEKDAGEISHFQALSAALSATIGLGNIAGVALAVGAGGPGAVFWMWICGFLGMATKFTTCTLSQMYRKVDDNGHVRGGPMYYIELGLGKRWKWMAWLFAIFCVVASFGGGNMFQSNQTASIIKTYFGVPSWITGTVLVFLVATVIIGGIKRIGNVASKIVPFMCAFYVAVALVIIIKHASAVPAMFAEIFSSAFSGRAAAGGFAGATVMYALRTGFQRACFSNEAGLGSAPIAHAAAKTDEPVREGVVAMIGPFIDTIVICTMTAMVILITGMWRPAPLGTLKSVSEKGIEISVVDKQNVRDGAAVAILLAGKKRGRVEQKTHLEFKVTKVTDKLIHAQWPAIKAEGEEAKASALKKRRAMIASLKSGAPVYRRFSGTQGGVELTALSFDTAFKGLGPLLSLAVFLFAFSTMVSWSYYGEQATEYLFGSWAILPYKIIFCVMIFVGSVNSLDPVINFSDAMLGLMAVPNLIGTILLFPRVRDAARDYMRRLKKGEFSQG